MNKFSKKTTPFLIIGLALTTQNAFADWDGIKKATSNLGKETLDVAEGAWDSTVSGSKKAWDVSKKQVESITKPTSKEESQKIIDVITNNTLNKLFNADENARILFDNAYSYAVFENESYSFLLKGNFGSGSLVRKDDGKKTYMKMLGAGAGATAGASKYRQVFFMKNRDTYEEFLAGTWESANSQQFVLGQKNGAKGFTDKDLVIYQLDTNGVLLDVSLSGNYYKVDKDLN